MKKLLTLFIALIPVLCFAQKENYIGINASGGSTGIWLEDAFTEYGIDVESRLTKLSGVGAGMSLVKFNNDTYQASMNYLRVPIFYTLHTKLVDVSPVIKMNFLQKRTFSPTIIWTNFDSFYPNFFFEVGLALSKDFLLTEDYYLMAKAQACFSPELGYINSLGSGSHELFSIGLGLRYKIN